MMVALFFILLGAIILFIAACRIWMNRPHQTFKETNSLLTTPTTWPSRETGPGPPHEQPTTRA